MAIHGWWFSLDWAMMSCPQLSIACALLRNTFWKGLFVTAHTNRHTDTNATAHLHFALLRSALHISLLGASHENWPWARECLGNIIYNIYVYMFTYIYSIALCLWARSRAFAAWLFVSSARAGLLSSADWNLQPSPIWWWFLAPLVLDCGSSDQILSWLSLLGRG